LVLQAQAVAHQQVKPEIFKNPPAEEKQEENIHQELQIEHVEVRQREPAHVEDGMKEQTAVNLHRHQEVTKIQVVTTEAQHEQFHHLHHRQHLQAHRHNEAVQETVEAVIAVHAAEVLAPADS
jgi:hypothetical protein